MEEMGKNVEYANDSDVNNIVLRIASENGKLDAVKHLYECGADITAKNNTSKNVQQAENTGLERDVVPANSNVTYEYGKEKIYTKIINFTDRDIELISIDAFTIVMSVDLKTKDGIINVQKTIELDKKYKIPLYVEVYENTNINYKYDNEDSDHDELVVVIDSTNGYVKINSCMFRCYLHALQDIKNKTELLKNNYAEFIIS